MHCIHTKRVGHGIAVGASNVEGSNVGFECRVPTWSLGLWDLW